MQKMKITLFAIILMVALAAAYADTAELNYTSGDVTIGLICGDVGTNVEAPPMAPGGAFDARILVDGVYYFEYYFNGEDADIALTTQAFVDGGEEQEITMDFVLTGYEVFYIGQDSLEVGGDPVPVVPGTITIDPDPIPAFVTQDLTLTTGWNFVSFNLVVENPAVQDFFGAISNSEGNEFVTDIKTSAWAAQYFADFDMWVGGNNSMELGTGYWVKVTQDCQLEVAGQPINPADYQIQLTTGWNSIGYLPNDDEQVQVIFANLTNPDGNEYVTDVKTSAWAAQYFIDFDMWVGGSNNMEKGVGYWVKVNTDCELQY